MLVWIKRGVFGLQLLAELRRLAEAESQMRCTVCEDASNTMRWGVVCDEGSSTLVEEEEDGWVVGRGMEVIVKGGGQAC